VSTKIADNITGVTDADHHEREDNTASLQGRTCENDFAPAQDTAVSVDSNEPLLTGSIMTDVNGERSQLDSRMLDALPGLATGTSQASEHYSKGQSR
jgi:hypothetical protein